MLTRRTPPTQNTAATRANAALSCPLGEFVATANQFITNFLNAKDGVTSVLRVKPLPKRRTKVEPVVAHAAFAPLEDEAWIQRHADRDEEPESRSPQSE